MEVDMPLELVNLSEINLNELPERKAVYAIFAQDKETKKPINCRYVGETDNLMERIKAHFSIETDNLMERLKAHFSIEEQNECLKSFMQSSKTKLMIYELMPNSTKEDRLIKEKEWISSYQPKCNE